jgi:hypothetical protein
LQILPAPGENPGAGKIFSLESKSPIFHAMKSKNQKSLHQLLQTLPAAKVKVVASRRIAGGTNEYPWQVG